jgi:hypothetical protein
MNVIDRVKGAKSAGEDDPKIPDKIRNPGNGQQSKNEHGIFSNFSREQRCHTTTASVVSPRLNIFLLFVLFLLLFCLAIKRHPSQRRI